MQAARVLIEIGANIEGGDAENRTALSWAALNGFVDMLELLLRSGANLEVGDQYLQLHIYSHSVFDSSTITAAPSSSSSSSSSIVTATLSLIAAHLQPLPAAAAVAA